MKNSVLIIDDDRQLAELVADEIERLGYSVEWASDGDEGLAKALEGNYLLVILDLRLPNLDGLEVCRRLQSERPELPVIILSSRSDELDRVIGLEAGADDYVCKPFHIRELVARVRSVIRRSRIRTQPLLGNGQAELDFGSLVIDRERKNITLNGTAIALTALEYEFLVFLASHPERPFTRAQLVERIWNYRASGYEDTVSALVRRLRKKIEPDPSNPTFIKTVRGMGYLFADPREAETKDDARRANG